MGMNDRTTLLMNHFIQADEPLYPGIGMKSAVQFAAQLLTT